MKTLFGFIASEQSDPSMAAALHFFDAFTSLRKRDEVVVERGSYAKAANRLLDAARLEDATLFILNDTTILTPGWREPLSQDIPAILASVSNQHITHQMGGLTWGPDCPLAQVRANQPPGGGGADRSRDIFSEYQELICVSSPCLKLTPEIYRAVGSFDERLTTRAAATKDYCLRGQLRGFATLLALESYVIAISTETPKPISIEDLAYFEQKWGKSLASAVLFGERSPLHLTSIVEQCARRGEFRSLIEELATLDGADRTVENGWTPTVAAVYCVYDDERWLEASLDSVYAACDKIYVLVGKQPWHGKERDNTETLRIIRSFPDPQGKIELRFGTWPDETAQRNDGLHIVAEAGIDYCLVVDADEVYEPEELRAIFRHISGKRFVPAWRIHEITYWKSTQYRISAPDEYKPPILVRPTMATFTQFREIGDTYAVVLPQDLGTLHHLSYARSDQEILNKITTFSHAPNIIPEWFERIWKRWDHSKQMENLHPYSPQKYTRAEPQNKLALPSPLRARVGTPKFL